MIRLARIVVPGALLMGLLPAGFTPPGLGFFGAGARVPAVSDLSGRNPQTTAYIELRRRQMAHHGRPWRPYQRWVPLSRISPALVNAVIAAEDGTFYRHRGVEWGLAWGAFRDSLRTGRKDRGASTITQQLARNLYLSPQKSYWRKLREMVVAQRMERRLSKRRILEIYLNIAEWGDGVYGAEAAARRYFGKPAADLTWDEAIALTAVLPTPRRHSPVDGSRWVERRKSWVRTRLLVTGRYAPPPAAPPPNTL